MPQGRIILKSICQSKKLAKLKTDAARLLYTWLLTNLDANGCFSGDVEDIKGMIFTKLSHTKDEIETYLQDIAECGLIMLYEDKEAEHRYIHVPDFVKKQPYLNPGREAKGKIPLPGKNKIVETLNKNLIEECFENPPPKREHRPLPNPEDYIEEEEKKPKYTLSQCIDVGAVLGIPEDRAIDFFHWYNGQGWKFGGKGQLPIEDLHSAMHRYKVNNYQFSGKPGKQSEQDIKDRVKNL